MLIKCPTCHRRGDWFAGPHGPFCCRRCKLVDLGKWFEEEHVISKPLLPDEIEPGAGKEEPPSEESGRDGA
jgi:uncharacterized protein